MQAVFYCKLDMLDRISHDKKPHPLNVLIHVKSLFVSYWKAPSSQQITATKLFLQFSILNTPNVARM